MAEQIRSGDHAARTLHPARGHADHRDHVVQFYESPEYLAESVGSVLARALHDGDAALAIATKMNLRSLDRVLAEAGVDLASARATERYVAMDADEALAAFMVDGSPDPDLFEASMQAQIARVARPGREVRIFGEMVAVLWAEGNVTAAIRLEELWNELARSRPFSLVCGYPMSAFKQDGDAPRFEEVCEMHSRVLPAESYAGIPDPDGRLRSVARLQQKAGAGAYEGEALRRRRMQLEDALAELRELDRVRNEFIAMVVHDIRAPTAVVGGFLELLRDHWSALDEERIKDALDRGLASAKQISSLVDDILAVAQLGSSGSAYETWVQASRRRIAPDSS